MAVLSLPLQFAMAGEHDGWEATLTDSGGSKNDGRYELTRSFGPTQRHFRLSLIETCGADTHQRTCKTAEQHPMTCHHWLCTMVTKAAP